MCPVVLCCVRLFPVVSNRVRLSTVSSKIEMTTVKNEILDIRSIVFGVRCPDTFFLLSVSFGEQNFGLLNEVAEYSLGLSDFEKS